MRILTILLAVVSLGTILLAAQMSPEGMASQIRSVASEAQPVATKGLETFRRLVNEQNYRRYGFESVAEISSASLGEPLVIYFVRLDQLWEYQPGTDPYRLLAGGNKVIFPVMAGQQARSSIVVDKVNGAWRAASFGGTTFVKLFTRIRSERAAPGAPAESTFAVEVPSLSLYFLGQHAGGQLMLISLTDPAVRQYKGRSADARRPGLRPVWGRWPTNTTGCPAGLGGVREGPRQRVSNSGAWRQAAADGVFRGPGSSIRPAEEKPRPRPDCASFPPWRGFINQRPDSELARANRTLARTERLATGRLPQGALGFLLRWPCNPK